MQYISAQEVANNWGISKRRVQTLCSEGRIDHAVRIGNMWVVPHNVAKPSDARKKKKTTPENDFKYNPMKAARNTIRQLSINIYNEILPLANSAYEAKIHTMVFISVEIVLHILGEANGKENGNVNLSRATLKSYIYKLFNVTEVDYSRNSLLTQISSFLINHPFCIDDALAWSYQFVNKISKDSGLESTQFFTEKYMITTLVDQADITHNPGKIVDPACGGGNFLIYALDVLCSSFSNSDLQQEIDTHRVILNKLHRLYGYELDPALAVIADIGIRIKVLEILSRNKIQISEQIFIDTIPNIYCSSYINVIGALDVNPEMHEVKRVSNSEPSTLNYVLKNAQFIFTNPPFQTIKGMSNELKHYLQVNYNLSKCDVCNAFLERALEYLLPYGYCGIVTQISWMYLNSFEDYRRGIVSKYTFGSIIEIGSNAFYDLSGEKTNIALLFVSKKKPVKNSVVKTYPLKQLEQSKIEKELSSKLSLEKYCVSIKQLDTLNNPQARFDNVSTKGIKFIQSSLPQYAKYATPMQGTSTGDAKKLISYFWEHLGDENWISVSKGGGFSRWQGLNRFSVKWGKSGEFVKATKGSAVRNEKYFNETQMVFSDTGTSGLNVRVLMDEQIFVASGPGIRIHRGETLCHLALLNSRLASYYIRTTSPKLTIAAGYISQIPLAEQLLTSSELLTYAKECITAKQCRLSKNPTNLEFVFEFSKSPCLSLKEYAIDWLTSDINAAWTQIYNEGQIDKLMLKEYHLTDEDINCISNQVGIHPIDLPKTNTISIGQLDKKINCILRESLDMARTKPSKGVLGCDSFLEYISVETQTSPSMIRAMLMENIGELTLTIQKYKYAFLHAAVLFVIGYSTKAPIRAISIPLDDFMQDFLCKFPALISEADQIKEWLCSEFNRFHSTVFFKSPVILFSSDNHFEVLGGIHDTIK